MVFKADKTSAAGKLRHAESVLRGSGENLHLGRTVEDTFDGVDKDFRNAIRALDGDEEDEAALLRGEVNDISSRAATLERELAGLQQELDDVRLRTTDLAARLAPAANPPRNV
jgi:hypothetical protein